MSKRAAYLALACLFTVHAVLLIGIIRRNFVTMDEHAHIAAGLYHWQTGTFAMYRVNPPLPRMAAALPVFLADPVLTGDFSRDDPDRRQEFILGRSFAQENRDQYFDLVCLARLAGIGWSMLGAWLIYHWADELYGRGAGLLAATLWCFGPNVLGHAALATPDIPCTVAGFAATYAFWRYLRQPSWPAVVLCGLLLGVAQLTKFTMLALYAVWPCLFLVYRFRRALPGTLRPRLVTQAAHGLLMVSLSLLVVNCGYGFTGAGQRLGELPFVSRTFMGEPPVDVMPADVGNRFRSHWVGRVPMPVPADFVRGLDVQQRDFERLGPYRGSYLAGEWRERGWWYYYLYGLGVKVPLGTWALLVLALAVMWRLPNRVRPTDELFLWLPALAFLALVSSQTGFNHHLRYVFPLLPFVCLSIGKVATLLSRPSWWGRLALPLLLGWTLVSSLRVYPHSLSYFNELAGGSDNGHAHLIDSNIDWGQDLLELRRWLDEHPEAYPIGLAYFGFDPSITGMNFGRVPTATPLFGDESAAARLASGPHPGYFAVSVNYLRGMSSATPQPRGTLHHDYEYFRMFRPVAKAGYSIYIYHITPEEANRVRREMGLPPLEAGLAKGGDHD